MLCFFGMSFSFVVGSLLWLVSCYLLLIFVLFGFVCFGVSWF